MTDLRPGRSDDLLSRIADLRCPDCGTRQPLYVSRAGGPAFLRPGSLVVPCPGCGLPLRVTDSTVDPHGILGAAVMVVGGTGGLLGLVLLTAERGWGEGVLVAGLIGGVLVLAALGVGWTLLRTRWRAVVVADDPVAPDGNR